MYFSIRVCASIKGHEALLYYLSCESICIFILERNGAACRHASGYNYVLHTIKSLGYIVGERPTKDKTSVAMGRKSTSFASCQNV